MSNFGKNTKKFKICFISPLVVKNNFRLNQICLEDVIIAFSSFFIRPAPLHFHAFRTQI
jgi:hypothetical protein